MKIGFYIHHSTLKAGGIFTYSIGILKLLLNSNEIQKICLIYSPEIRQDIAGFLNNPKVEPVEIDRKKWNIKIPYYASYFFYDNYLLINNYFPDSKKIEFLKNISFWINPYRMRINKKNVNLLHVTIQYSPVYSLNIPIIIKMNHLQEFHFRNFSPARKGFIVH